MPARFTVAIAHVLFASLLACGSIAASEAKTMPPRAPQPRVAARTAASTQTDWPQLGYDSGHSGHNPRESIVGTHNVAQLAQAWSFSTGFGNGAANIVEAAGTVFAASSNGTLYALNAATGEKLWSYATGTGYGSSGSTPAVDQGLVFTVCTEEGGAQGICALNAANGSLVWSYAVPGATSFAEAPPAVANGAVYFGGCGTSCAYVALSEPSGNVLWSAAEPTGCAMNAGVPPALAGGLLFATVDSCTQNPETIALNATNAAPVWQTQIYGAFAGMSVAGGILAVVSAFDPTGEGLVTFNATTGSVRWYRAFKGAAVVPGYPAIARNKLYVQLVGGLSSWKLSSRHGHAFWFGKQGREPSASIANGVLYTVRLGNPTALDAGTGKMLWSAPASSASAGFPIIVNGVVYGACNGTNICAWSLPGARVRRR